MKHLTLPHVTRAALEFQIEAALASLRDNPDEPRGHMAERRRNIRWMQRELKRRRR
jgi:hypothetical protein